MAVSVRLRFEVLRRDDFTCRYCGLHAPDVELEVDHVIPAALGGSDDPTNLATACKPCNSGKASIHPSSDLVASVSESALRWRSAVIEAGVQMSLDRLALASVRSKLDELWDSWVWVDPTTGGRAPRSRPLDWMRSLDGWVASGLEYYELERLVEIAMVSQSRDVWAYFCGVVRNYLAEKHERALAIANPDTWSPKPL